MVQIVWSVEYAHPLPKDHRFPMLKYELIPGQLLHEGVISMRQIHKPGICSDAVIGLTHSEEYLHKLNELQLTASEQRRIGFPQSFELVYREKMITQGTIDCALHALKHGVALNVAGGTHHAFADRGEGFCLLNDMAVASNYLLHNKLATKILIVDLDVHQGNGTAALFRNKPEVFTFSMHGAHNYPFHKEQSDLDIPLADGTDTKTYLQILQSRLPELISTQQPDFVFYLSGVDILETDKYGKLKVTMQGCLQRDLFVLETCKMNRIPLAIAMGGGYSADVKIITAAHCQTFRAAVEIFG